VELVHGCCDECALQLTVATVNMFGEWLFLLVLVLLSLLLLLLLFVVCLFVVVVVIIFVVSVDWSDPRGN